jgi:L-fucose isomerase-like protein
VLDFDPKVLWHQCLHADEHDERQPDSQRVRSGHYRRAGDVCAATRFGQAERARGLEQQLCRRAEQVRAVPLWQLAQDFFSEINMSYGEILATVLGQENTYGTVSAQAVPNPLTYARITTDDRHGKIKTYVGEGRITDDLLQTFGSRAVVEIPGLQELMRYVCKNGYEHHAAINPSHVAEVLVEAFETYMDWEVYHHQG